MKYNDFHYAMSLLSTLYDITLQEEDFEEIALTGWQRIGNKRSRLYRLVTNLNCKKEFVLPCNVDEIEAVTAGFEEWDYTNNRSDNGDIQSAYTERYIENRKTFKHPLYIPGKFIKYERVGNTLYFDQPYNHIFILYKGELLDDNGLPEITDKEATALAAYCAYVVKYKEGLKTNNPNIIQLAEKLQRIWLIQCDQARVGEYMSQNDWDQVLDAKTSWQRKQYGRSSKLYQ